MDNRLLKPFLLSIAAAVALYILLMLFAGYQETARAASLLTPRYWLILVSLMVVHLALRFLRWQWYLHKLGHSVAWIPSCAYYLAGFALTTTPGKVGETIRSAYLKPHGVGYSDSLAAFLAERYTDLLAVATLTLLVAPHIQDEAWPSILFGLLLLVAVLVIRLPALPFALDQLADRLASERLATLLRHAALGLRAAASLLELRTLIASYLLALVAWGIQALILYYILQFMGFPLTASLAVGIFALGLLAGALSFIPGGLGSTEAVMILMLVQSDIATPDASASTLLCRVATLWLAVAIGCVALLAVEVRRRRGAVVVASE